MEREGNSWAERGNAVRGRKLCDVRRNLDFGLWVVLTLDGMDMDMWVEKNKLSGKKSRWIQESYDTEV